MTTESAVRERLIAEIARKFRCFGTGTTVPAGNPIAVALKDKPPLFAAGVDVGEVVDFFLSAFPELTRAPGKDAVEGARQCHAEMGKCDSYDESLHVLTAALVAHAAAEREACAVKLSEIADTHRRLAAQLVTINQHAMAEMQRIRAEEADGNAAAIRAGGSK